MIVMYDATKKQLVEIDNNDNIDDIEITYSDNTEKPTESERIEALEMLMLDILGGGF